MIMAAETVPPAPSAPARRAAIAVMIMTLLLPVALAIVALPTPMGDLREQIAWGRHFPLVTPHHPPLMVWASGLIDRIFGPSLIAQLIGGQIVFAIGAAYTYRTLRLVTDRDVSFLFLFLYVTGFYVVVGPASWVLNADSLQVLSWPALVFHFLAAARFDRWRDWVMVGIFAALAVLTKYTAGALLAAMAIAGLAVPEIRKVLRRPGLYVAAAIGAALTLPHLIALAGSPGALSYGAARFVSRSLPVRLANVGELGVGYLFMLAPAWALVPIWLWRGDLVTRRPSESTVEWPPARRFVLLLNAAIVGVVAALILFAGLGFIFRFAIPFAAIAVPALAMFFAWREGRRERGERALVGTVATVNLLVAIGASVAYVGFTSHGRMQEPYPGPGDAVMAEWRARFPCGPAYVTGSGPVAHLMAIHAGRDVTGLAADYLDRVTWFDAEKLRREGAVIVDFGPIEADRLPPALRSGALTEERTSTWPLLRTRTGKTLTYHYRFLPPAACPAP